MRRILIGIVLGSIGSFVATTHAQLKPVPSAAPGVTNVTGGVEVTNQPTVLARQDGVWKVTCTQPSEPVAPLVGPGQRVSLTYVTGARETVQVSSVRDDGWITVGSKRINLATVVSIERE